MLYGVTDPRGKDAARAFEATIEVQREIDPDLRVVWDAQRQKFLVLDTKAPGGPDSSYVLLVQNPDGSFRPWDQRTLDTLRKIRRENHDAIKAEVERLEDERQKRIVRNRQNVADDLAHDFKWIGSQPTPSVAWRDRSEARETIRKEAK